MQSVKKKAFSSCSDMCLYTLCLQRYLVAVGGMALHQQRREQLDQALGAEDAVLLEQEGVLEPAIPQPSSIRGEAGAVERVGEELQRCTYTHRFYDYQGNLDSRLD